MVHSAYDSFELLQSSAAKIDAVGSYGHNLLLSCSDGSLRIYSPESSAGDPRSPPPQSPELKKEPYVLERTISGSSKKPMLAMEVLKSRELLLSLSESIAFHRLPNFETLAVITKAKGANPTPGMRGADLSALRARRGFASSDTTAVFLHITSRHLRRDRIMMKVRHIN